MALEGELSFITEAEGLTLQGVLGTRRVLAYRNFLNVLVKGGEEPVRGELTHGEINNYGGNVLGRIGLDWKFSCDINSSNIAGMYEFVFRVTYKGREPADVNLSMEVMLEDEGEPRWLVPGLFYKDGRPASGPDGVPRFACEGADGEPFTSNKWAFRADRSSHPGVFAWTGHATACLTVNEQINGHVAGVAFRCEGGTTAIGLNFPYREQPAGLATCDAEPNSPSIDWLHVEPDDQVYLRFKLFFAPRDLHRYNDVLRDRYYTDTRSHHCHPWMDGRQACDLAAAGLIRWHYDAGRGLLYDACAFDRSFAAGPQHVYRPEMHSAGPSGAHCAHALLWYGRRFGRPDCVEAATRVIASIAAGLAPAGTFHPCTDAGGNWSAHAGGTISAHEAAETTLFLARTLAHEQKAGHRHPDWEQAVKSSLQFAGNIQRDDGSFGSAYDAASGEVTDWEGTGGLLWVAACIEGYRHFRNVDCLQSASLGAEYYAQFVHDEYLAGTRGSVPSSVDGYYALLAYVGLYHEDENSQWLELAKSAADWLLSFRYCCNVAFHPETMLFQFDFRTRGADIAGSGASWLHNYGLVCYPELVQLGRLLGDGYYLERAHDQLQCLRQFIARYDSDFGARIGMCPARFYHTESDQPKGHAQQMSHASGPGLILYANLWDIEHGACGRTP